MNGTEYHVGEKKPPIGSCMMKNCEKEVRSKGVVVGTAVYPIYDTIDESIADLGDASVLLMINAQIKTNRANQMRQQVSAKPTKATLMVKAFAIADFALLSEMAGDEVRIANYMAELCAKLAAEAEEAASVTPAAAEIDDGVEEGDLD